MRFFWCIAWWILLPLCGHALEVSGTTYIDLDEAGSRLGMRSRWLEKDKVLQLESEWTRLVCEVHKREVRLNGVQVHLGFPVVAARGRLYLSQSDFTHQLQPILTPQLNGPPPPLRHIVLDPGHGGKDPGAENKALGLREKALTLDLAKRVQRLLEQNGLRVTLTRDDDTFISLEERGKAANRAGADLFVSLHFNAAQAKAVSGVETYAYTPPMQPSTARASLQDADRKSYPAQASGGWSTLAAYHVQQHLASGLKADDRGLKRARFKVLEELRMPGLLVEGGFVSSTTEGKNLGSAAYRNRMAQAIVDGILQYRKALERSRGKG